MKENKSKTVLVGAVALVALLLMASFPYIADAAITGAVAGESYRFEQCLKKYGTNNYGKWMYDEIQKCREEITKLEKGKDKAIPRLYLSDDRSEFQNE